MSGGSSTSNNIVARSMAIKLREAMWRQQIHSRLELVPLSTVLAHFSGFAMTKY
jgi:hypothetical protein